MARFFGSLQGRNGPATRLGSTNSGIEAEARGWHVGVRVSGHANGDDDEFDIYATGGSTASSPSFYIGTVQKYKGRLTFRPAKTNR